MPPRKRAASAPKAEPETAQDELAASTDEEQQSGSGEDLAPDKPANPAPPAAEAPCTDCFPAGWPDEATSVGCGHGTWNREL